MALVPYPYLSFMGCLPAFFPFFSWKTTQIIQCIKNFGIFFNDTVDIMAVR